MEVTPSEMEEAKEQMKFEDIALEDGTIVSADSLEVGSAVFIMVEEEKQPLPVGEYALADGSLLIVAEEGIIAELKEAEKESRGDNIDNQNQKTGNRITADKFGSTVHRAKKV